MVQISLSVDGVEYPESWRVSGAGEMISTAKAYVGGSEAPYEMPGQIGANSNFVGCLRKVTFQFDFCLKKENI